MEDIPPCVIVLCASRFMIICRKPLKHFKDFHQVSHASEALKTTIFYATYHPILICALFIDKIERSIFQ